MIRVKHLLFISLACLFSFSACISSIKKSPTDTVTDPIQSFEQSPTETSIPSPTPLISPTLNLPSTLPSPQFTILPTSIQNPGAWNIQYRYSDPDQSPLINLTSEGYQLDPTFQVASIELSYRWIGIGDPVRIYQRIEERDGNYWRGDSQVSQDAVSTLVQSITHLYPQPHILSATTHTDDYPFWAVELTDVRGFHVLLHSESNSTGFVPWNVIYNGKIYTHLETSIASALLPLFDIVQGETLASFWSPEQKKGNLRVVTTEEPAQLSHGFNGLIPLNNALIYHPDNQRKELRGRIRTLTWDEGPDNLIIGTITEIQRIELEIAGESVPCLIEFISSTSPENYAWDFVCPTDEMRTDLTFHFPVSVTLSTSTNQVHTLFGEFNGYWEPVMALPHTPYPEEIEVILKSSSAVRDLLEDHQVVVLNFIANADLEKGLLDNNWEAELVLLGQIRIDDRVLPYTITLQVSVNESKLTHWDINRSELLSLIKDTLSQSITQHFLDLDPDLILNLYYGEESENPLVFEENLRACASLPVADKLPSPGYPMRGFGFNQHWNIYSSEVLLMRDGLRINHLDINPSSAEDAIWASLLPPELKPSGVPLLRLIFKRPMSQGIGFYWDENSSVAAVERYNAIYKNWNVPKEDKNNGVFIDQVMFDITADGHLGLVFCQEP